MISSKKTPPPEQAALKTFTGKVAEELGFKKARVLNSSKKNSEGTYISVDVLFIKQ